MTKDAGRRMRATYEAAEKSGWHSKQSRAQATSPIPYSLLYGYGYGWLAMVMTLSIMAKMMANSSTAALTLVADLMDDRWVAAAANGVVSLAPSPYHLLPHPIVALGLFCFVFCAAQSTLDVLLFPSALHIFSFNATKFKVNNMHANHRIYFYRLSVLCVAKIISLQFVAESRKKNRVCLKKYA